MLTSRKSALLEAVVAEHIRTAEPVGSKLLAGKYKIAVSSATVRNDLASLEEEGYLTHPHTSAGRVPTVKGYRYYINHCLSEKSLTKKERSLIDGRCGGEASDDRYVVKAIAKAVADIAQEAILVGFDRDDVYYTGLSYLLAQPEFSDHDFTITMSHVLDRLDEAMGELVASVHDDVAIAIGDENPFGDDTSVVIVRYGKGRGQFFGILGPTRMNYGANIALAKYAREMIVKHSNE